MQGTGLQNSWGVHIGGHYTIGGDPGGVGLTISRPSLDQDWKRQEADRVPTGLLCVSWRPSLLPASRHDRSSLVDMAEPETPSKAARNIGRHYNGRLSPEQEWDFGGRHGVRCAGGQNKARERT